MGGDTFVSQIAGEDDEARARRRAARCLGRGPRLPPRARQSGKTEHVEAFLELFGVRDLADAWTTSDDVDKSKPEPDIVRTALDELGGVSGVMIGDSIYDALAAGKLDIPTIAVRTGGFGTDELQDAGASHVIDT